MAQDFHHSLKNFMDTQNNNPIRNRPSEEGRDNDPNVRDESAAQPGISTMSSSDTDRSNQETTESVSDYQDTSDFDDEDADVDFDEVYDDPEDDE